MDKTGESEEVRQHALLAEEGAEVPAVRFDDGEGIEEIDERTYYSIMATKLDGEIEEVQARLDDKAYWVAKRLTGYTSDAILKIRASLMGLKYRYEIDRIKLEILNNQNKKVY